jgi:hypothetical protein
MDLVRWNRPVTGRDPGDRLAIASAELAQAAQGPGIAPGTASAFLQFAMAVIVYGACAATVLGAAVLRITRRA